MSIKAKRPSEEYTNGSFNTPPCVQIVVRFSRVRNVFFTFKKTATERFRALNALCNESTLFAQQSNFRTATPYKPNHSECFASERIRPFTETHRCRKILCKSTTKFPVKYPFPQFYKTTPQCRANECVRTASRTDLRTQSVIRYGFKFNCRNFADNSAFTASNVPSALTETNGILPSSFLTAA